MKNTREKLLDAGAKLFAEKGYDSTSIGEIEHAVGLTPRAGGFYRHFKSKEALLIAIVDARFESSFVLELQKIFELGDTKTQLLMLADAYRRMADQSWEISRIVSNEIRRLPKLKRKIRQTNAKVIASLRNWVATKPHLKSSTENQQNELVLSLVGGWLFYLTKKSQDEKFFDVNESSFMNSWADLWASILDSPKSAV